MRRYRVTVTATNTNKKFPEFEGKLYEARDDPEEGELTYTSEELKSLNVVGGPVCVEHDYKLGRVGVIRASRYQHPWLLIQGVIDTEDVQIREAVRKSLRDGELSELSIGFHGIYDDASQSFSEKVFDEASLVRKGYYEGTNIVAVYASKNTGRKEQITIVRNTNDLLKLVRASSTGDGKHERGTWQPITSHQSSSPLASNLSAPPLEKNNSAYKTSGEKLFATFENNSDKIEVFVQASNDPPANTVPPPSTSNGMSTAQEPAAGVAKPVIPVDEDTTMDAGESNVQGKVADSSTFDTKGMTPQQIDNYYRKILEQKEADFQKTLEQSKSSVSSVLQEKEQLEKHAAALEEFKKQKDEEYRASQKEHVKQIDSLREQLGAGDEIKDMLDKMSGSQETKGFWDFMVKLKDDAMAAKEALSEQRKQVAALKRANTKQQAVAVKASEREMRAQRVRQIGVGNALQPVSGGGIFDIISTKQTPKVVMNQSTLAPPATTVVPPRTSTTASLERFANQKVVDVADGPDDDVMADEQQVAENEKSGASTETSGTSYSDEFRRIVYSRNSKVASDALIKRASDAAHLFPHSMSQNNPEMFLELMRMQSESGDGDLVVGGPAYGREYNEKVYAFMSKLKAQQPQ